jgi:hypothetical protein
MHKRNKNTTQLNCFSPPVMLATFAIETIFAMYVLWRYRLDTIARLTVATLSFLALFQISEYFVCGGAGLTAQGWAKVGYVSITLLPPLGLHMLHVLGRKPQRKLVIFGYTTAVAFIAYFLGYNGAFAGYQCTGNYVIFQLAVHSGLAYGVYYYGWLLTVLSLAYRWIGELKEQVARMRKQRETLWGLSVGYLVFLVPTAIANTVKPETRQGIPSIMCGFAVLFAVIIIAYLMPRAGKLRKRS